MKKSETDDLFDEIFAEETKKKVVKPAKCAKGMGPSGANMGPSGANMGPSGAEMMPPKKTAKKKK